MSAIIGNIENTERHFWAYVTQLMPHHVSGSKVSQFACCVGHPADGKAPNSVKKRRSIFKRCLTLAVVVVYFAVSPTHLDPARPTHTHSPSTSQQAPQAPAYFDLQRPPATAKSPALQQQPISLAPPPGRAHPPTSQRPPRPLQVTVFVSGGRASVRPAPLAK